MDSTVKSVRTKIIAKDCRQLAKFYMSVFHCTPISLECGISGKWLDKVSAIDDVDIRKICFGLPDHKDEPVFEISECSTNNKSKNEPVINHQELSFYVDSVEAVLANLMANGGEQLGGVMVEKYEGIGTLKVAYACDPEGNIIEIQNWQK